MCNQQEAGILFSEDYENITPEELCAILQDRIRSAKIPQMVVTMGKAGAVYATLEGDAGVYPALKVDVVDTTGAGDSFNAGFVYGFLMDKDTEECLRLGNACGALSVTALGGNSAFPARKYLDDFLSAE